MIGGLVEVAENGRYLSVHRGFLSLDHLDLRSTRNTQSTRVTHCESLDHLDLRSTRNPHWWRALEGCSLDHLDLRSTRN